MGGSRFPSAVFAILVASAATSVAKTTVLTCADGVAWSKGTWDNGTPEAGDTVVLRNTTGAALETENDCVDALAAVITEGPAALTLKGRDLALTGDASLSYNATTCKSASGWRLAISNGCPLTVKAALSFSGTKPTVYMGNTITFDGAITLVDAVNFGIDRLWSGGGYGVRAMTFNAAVTGLAATLTSAVQDNNTVTFNAPVQVNVFKTAANCAHYFKSGGNAWETFSPSNSRFYWMVPGAIPPGMGIKLPNASDVDYRCISYFYQDETLAFLNGGAWQKTSNIGNTLASTCGATLSLTSAVSATVACTLGPSGADSHALSFTYAPSEPDCTQTFTDRIHYLDGTITVKNGGTLDFTRRTRFPNLSAILLANGTFRTSATNETVQFPALKSLTVNAGGLFACACPKTPFADGVTELILRGDGAINVPAGMTNLFKRVYVAGVVQSRETVFTAANCTWVTGEGAVRAAESEPNWKAAVDGAWTDAAKWTESVNSSQAAALRAEGASYVVTLAATPDPMPTAITVANYGGDTATLKTTGDVAFGATPVNIRSGGKLEVAAGSVYARTGSASDQAITLEKGGKLRVEGTLDSVVTASARAVSMAAGATAEIAGGTARFVGRTASAAMAPIALAGGEMTVSGNGLLFVSNSMPVTANGTLTFKDNAVFKWFTPKDSLFQFMPAEGKTFTWTFADNSEWIWPQYTSWPSLYFAGSASSSHTVLNLASPKINPNVGTLYLILGASYGLHELNLSAGRLAVGGHSPRIGGSSSDGEDVAGASAEGILRVTGTGSFYNGSTSQYQLQLNGIVLGRGWCAKPSNPGWYKGTLYVADQGCVTNAGTGYIIAGAGYASGAIYQAGGTIHNANANYQTILGAWGGDGRWVVSNGTSYVKCDVYVGGIHTNLLAGNANAGNDNRPNWPWIAKHCRVDGHDAKGLLRVSGGSFTSEKTIYVGLDGYGRMELGSAGEIAADTICFTNTITETATVPATIACEFGSEGVGTARARKIVLAAGTRLDIDLGTYAGKKSTFRVLQADEMEGTLASEDITVTGDLAPLAQVYVTARAVTVSIARGTCVILR